VSVPVYSTSMKRFSVGIAAATVVAAFCAGAARGAAPRIVIVSGKPLVRQVAISNWHAIFVVVQEAVSAPVAARAQLARRPRLRLALFWGPRWIEYLREGKRASALRPGQADQHGSFYPAWHGLPALIDLGGARRWPRVVSARAEAVLRRYRVPVRVG
jgi:hypothetical protein